MRDREHFLTLDGLRGVAAFSVMLYHRRWLGPGGHLLDHSYLAVDFFFALSGFVVAHAYQSRLASGRMGFQRFCVVRAVRLYPLIVVGALLAGAYWLAYHADRIAVLIDAGSAMAAFPAPIPVHLTDQEGLLAFPINNPGWSLFFELLASAVIGLFASLLNVTVLVAIVSLSFVLVAVEAFRHDGIAYFGVYYTTLPDGIPRTAFSFFVGVLVHSLHARNSLPKVSIHPLCIAAALLGIFAVNKDALIPAAWYDLLSICVLFPALLVLGCQNEPAGRLVKFAVLSGGLSYPIYALHYPMFLWYETLHLPRVGFLMTAPILVPILSYVVLKYFDEPIRARLRGPSSLTAQAVGTD